MSDLEENSDNGSGSVKDFIDQEVEESDSEVTSVKDFFDQEAEVSGSEASDDESETGENDYIDDEPDEQLDPDEVEKQNQKLFRKHLLAEDKEVEHQLMERYLPDGELYSEFKREKKFRWKNVESTWVDNLSDTSSSSSSDSDDEDDGPNYQFKIKRSESKLTASDSQSQTKLMTKASLSTEQFTGSVTTSTVTGGQMSIEQFTLRDKNLVEDLSRKRKVSNDKLNTQIKRYKPTNGPTIFDLYVI